MDLRHLQTLCAVIDSGGFTRAADRLYLTQSAVSFQIRQLEEALGTTLFDRSPSGVRPTQSGEVLYRYARKLLVLAAEAREEIGAVELARHGRVRIGATDVCALFLPEVLHQFSELHPDVEIAVFEGAVTQVVDRVQTGQADMGVVPHLEDVVGVGFTPLFDLVLAAVCRGDHPLAERALVTVADLAAYPLAVYEQGSVVRQVVERACAAQGLRPRIAFESNWLTSILRAVEAGLGMSVLPISLAVRPHDVLAGPARDLIGLIREHARVPRSAPVVP